MSGPAAPPPVTATRPAGPHDRTAPRSSLRFSLSYFAGRTTAVHGPDAYRFLLETARFADAHGFHAVWTPERHFVEFGGLFPNPSVTSAALAVATERVRLRAGSVVLPLHHPVRVVEEWAVVDNLSDGRVGISLATGWHRDDFVLRPEAYEHRVAQTRDAVDQLRRLWSGAEVAFPGVDGTEQMVRTLPRPVQQELPLWLTSSGTEDSFTAAGRLGLNLLTGIFSRSVDDLAALLPRYFDALEEHGHPRDRTEVTVMLHTFLAPDRQRVRAVAYEPLVEYFRSYLGQHQGAYDGAPALDDEALDRQARFAVEHYLRNASLLGTPDSCAPLLDRLAAMGVTEIACLVDFGIGLDDAVSGLRLLDELRAAYTGAGR